MASAGKMQPMRISEFLGKPKSAIKDSVSERKKLEPVRIKQLMESVSKSCSRSTDRSTRPTFLIPNRGVRRKLYERSPSPRGPKTSICLPRSSTRPTTRASHLPLKNQNLARLSLFPSKSRISILPPDPPKSSGKSRKSFLLPPNSIVKQHMDKIHEKTILESSLSPDEENSSDNCPQEEIQRPTVIIRSQSSKKSQKPSVSSDDSNFSREKSSQNLEKSIENKENIPPAAASSPHPLTESKSLSVDPQLLQESAKRLERLEVVVERLEVVVERLEVIVEEKKNTEERILKGVEQILDFLKTKTERNEKSITLGDVDGVLDKENVSSGGKNRRRSRASPFQRRRSARLAEKQNNEHEDSFSRLEETLNVKSTGKTKIRTPVTKTPVQGQFLMRRCKSERVLREYLAIKASMNYLETPEAGKLKDMGANTPSGKNSLRRSISRKVFDELQDLYDDDIE
ncbi:uncharacterized protein [Fopius arisanus]|uniref:Uncharacterized protein n=1 Tax=Fopius arisanus TaxID=64838 RepID=A0A9R1SU31_9HYME|nr:PREDICTED: uncharacterized protein LOC105262955 [Fopius arisanus]